MEKKKRFVLATSFLTLVFLAIELFLNIDWYYQGVLFLGLLTALVLFLTFKDFVEKWIFWPVLIFLPVSFTLSAALFYFLIPKTWLFLTSGFFFLGLYSSFLIENVFLVSLQVKTVPLYRAAHTVSFLLLLLISFFFFNTIFSFRFPFWANALLVALATFPLAYFSSWSSLLAETQASTVLRYSVIVSLIMAQVALAISFWPLGVNLSSLYMVSFFYVIGGLTRAALRERLFKTTIKEFIWVGIGIFLALFLTTSWQGKKF